MYFFILSLFFIHYSVWHVQRYCGFAGLWIESRSGSDHWWLTVFVFECICATIAQGQERYGHSVCWMSQYLTAWYSNYDYITLTFILIEIIYVSFIPCFILSCYIKHCSLRRHGKASFGILLLQDLAVVPLLVVVELLSRGGAGLGKALVVAGVKALVTLSAMSIIGYDGIIINYAMRCMGNCIGELILLRIHFLVNCRIFKNNIRIVKMICIIKTESEFWTPYFLKSQRAVRRRHFCP